MQTLTNRNYQFLEGFKDDVRGSTVYGVNEEQLGKIDDLIFDEKTGSIKYAVIDSGGVVAESSHPFAARTTSAV